MSTALDRIKVPNLSSRKLVKEAAKKLGLTFVDPDFKRWDFIGDDRGRTFDTRIWMHDRDRIPAEYVREQFTKRDFHGNVAAFITWMLEHDLGNRYSTIPRDREMFRLGDSLVVPHTRAYGDDRKLCLFRSPFGVWEERETWHFLAFKKVKKR
jgi:hypothetical protein